ncbi:MAG: mannose-1-phosphate guanylyltransferase, partial [Planctomycetota bacterium]
RECPSVPRDQVVAEPLMRNTAAAIGLAAFLIRERDPDAVMVVVPADHAIEPPENFLATFNAAIERAREAPVLITVGIVPSGPATGYGYIEGGDQVATVRDHPVHTCLSFKEKPDPATASKFVDSGRYFWNSGTFVWTVASLLQALERHLPGHYSILSAIAKGAAKGEDIDQAAYAKLEHVPIDIGVMEKAENVEVIPADFVWDDVGSWLALARLRERDVHSNVPLGLHVELDTKNCIVVSDDDHLIATLGIENLIVVHTEDATLVCRKDRAEDVRKLVALLRAKGLERFL